MLKVCLLPGNLLLWSPGKCLDTKDTTALNVISGFVDTLGCFTLGLRFYKSVIIADQTNFTCLALHRIARFCMN